MDPHSDSAQHNLESQQSPAQDDSASPPPPLNADAPASPSPAPQQEPANRPPDAEDREAAPGVQRRPRREDTPRRLSPAELAATVNESGDVELAQELESMMQGIEEHKTEVREPTGIEPQRDDLIFGRVANVGSEDVLIDFDGKSLGTMPMHEAEKGVTYNVGDKLEVQVLGRDNRSGLLMVSRKKAKRAALLRDMKSGIVVEGEVTGMNRGGLEVNVEGLRAFIPASQVDLHFLKDISSLIGQKINAEVTRCDFEDDQENIVLSRRKVLMREEAERKEHAFETLEAGQLRKGVVRNIMDYGAFIDIGGVDGLLHITDMSWGRVNKPDDVVKVGDEVEVMVTKVNKDKKKVSLSLKQTKPDPWTNAADQYIEGSRVSGRVVRMEKFGAFVELEPGLDGLIPISEMSWTQRVHHPSELLKEGDVVDAAILSVDAEKRRMSLSLKAMRDDPWAIAAVNYSEGSMIRGKVVRTTDFGAFVQLEEGIDGLIHISELSEERIRSVTDKVQPGQEVEVRVLKVDPEAKRISLSMKPQYSGPSADDIAAMEADRAAKTPKKPAKPRRGGISYGWDEGMTLGGLDPSKFG